MFDEFERLCQTPALFLLLGHYAGPGARDRETWQDRVMTLDGVTARELSRLHGELIAYGWVEQNTGTTPVLKPGVAACCYRVTAAGLKTFKLARKHAESHAHTEAHANAHTEEDLEEVTVR
jgi:hypothetical protein